MGTTHHRRRQDKTSRSKMKAALFLLSALVASSQAVPKSRNELTCSICIDIITDLDNFITSDTTEDQIVQFFKELCHTLGGLLGASIEEQCNALMESQLPAIIDGLVNDNLNPQQVCDSIGMCPWTFFQNVPVRHFLEHFSSSA